MEEILPQYIGTKIINAKPMTRLEYSNFRDWELPADENPNDEGYLVEYLDGGEPNTKHYEGYVSWSPKEQFDNAYKSSGNLSFGDAIAYMKLGHKVARSGWNGKGMFIAISDNLKQAPLPADKFWNPHAKQAAIENGGSMLVLPTIIMKTATDEILMGWLASQSDMLSEDWELV